MKKLIIDLSLQKAARIAGVGLIIIFLNTMLVSIGATYKLVDGFWPIWSIIIYAFNVMVALGLFVLLKPVNKNLSLLAAVLRLVPMPLSYVVSFISDDYVQSVVLVFNFLQLFIFGYLIYKSGYIPRILGLLLIIASFGFPIVGYVFYVVDHIPSELAIFGLLMFIPIIAGPVLEFSLGIWLLLKGSELPGMENHNEIHV